jgi:hypothetical protein
MEEYIMIDLEHFDKFAKNLTIGESQEMYEKYKIMEHTENEGIKPAHTHDVRTSKLLKLIKYYEDFYIKY